jgi:hypothetical protein
MTLIIKPAGKCTRRLPALQDVGTVDVGGRSIRLAQYYPNPQDRGFWLLYAFDAARLQDNGKVYASYEAFFSDVELPTQIQLL